MDGLDLSIAQRFNTGNLNPKLLETAAGSFRQRCSQDRWSRQAPKTGTTDVGYNSRRHFVALKPLDDTIEVDGD